jgi:hypothetical protein
MPIGKLFYSRRRLYLNLPGITRVFAWARQGTEIHYNPGARRELALPALPGE